MPMLGRNTTLSLIAFGIVLFVAVLCRPYTATFFHRIEYTDVVSHVIGIELGRTYSRVGVFKNQVFEIVSDEQGRSAIPNYVAFLDNGTSLVGFEAKERALSNPKITIYDFRQLIGRNFSDPELQAAIKELPYDIVDVKGEPAIKIGNNGDYTVYSPGDISGSILRKLKSMAETHLNTTVKHAMVAVPFYFNEKQKQAVNDSVVATGISVLRTPYEPESVGIAYHIDIKPCDEAAGQYNCTYILYDVTREESRLTLLFVDRGIFEIKGTVEDTHSSWEGFEALFMTHQVHLNAPINQLSERVIDLVNRLLINAKLEKKYVDGIIATGDPSRVSEVQGILKAYFPGKKTLTPVGFEHDQAIVYGATWQGQFFVDSEQGCTLSMPDNPLSLGIETARGNFLKLIDRDTVLPVRKVLNITTSADNQEKVIIRILEGEREVADKNRLISTLDLTSIPTQPKGIPEISIVFELDIDQILTVIAKIEGGSDVAKFVGSVRSARYTWEEIGDIVQQGQKFYEEDLQELREASNKILNGVEQRVPVASEPEMLAESSFGLWRWLVG